MELAELLAQTTLTKEIKQDYTARLLTYKDMSTADIKQAVKNEGRIYENHKKGYYENTYARKLAERDEETGEKILVRVHDLVLDCANDGLYIAYAYMINHLLQSLIKNKL